MDQTEDPPEGGPLAIAPADPSCIGVEEDLSSHQAASPEPARVDLSEAVDVRHAVLLDASGKPVARCSQLRVEQAMELTQGSQSMRFSMSGTYSVLQEMGLDEHSAEQDNEVVRR